MSDRNPAATSPAEVPLAEVKYDAHGLVAAIVQDARTGEVLTLAWMSAESLAQTLTTGRTTFWSRSRQELWVKGATSGNTQSVKAVRIDCDRDALLVRVEPAGPACHTGAVSCFSAPLHGAPQGPKSPGETLAALEGVLRHRRTTPPPGSYTGKLFADETLRHKKVGEEATELIIASLRGSKDEIAGEAADLVFHALVLLQAHGMGLEDVAVKLREREGKRRP